MLALAVPIGLLIGLSLGALGGGGSVLTVPALVYPLGQDTHTATSGSLLIVGVTALAGMSAHYRAGRVRVAAGVVFGVLGIAGSYVGSRLSAKVDPDVLLAAFSLLMLVVAAVMFARVRRDQGVARAAGLDEGPIIRLRPSFGCACPRAAKVLVTATAVGLLTGFFGVGGGFVVVPALVLVLGLSMPVAIGTSLLVISINSTSALIARMGHGLTLDWAVIGTFTAAAVIGSLLGGWATSRVHPRRLSQVFALLLVVVALYTAARSIPALV